MRPIALFALCCALLAGPLYAQELFPERCLGTWKGTMYIYTDGHLTDSLAVRFTAARTEEQGSWTWRTEYLSASTPVTKDYVLRLKDPERGIFVIDEGGTDVYTYQFENTLLSVFATAKTMLTASYALESGTLLFQVTSGHKVVDLESSIANFSVSQVQRVALRRADSRIEGVR